MAEYKVGQLLFVIQSDEIVPVKVFEVIVRKTAEGERITYMVTKTDAGGEALQLERSGHDVFESMPEVKEFLMRKCEGWVQRKISDAMTNVGRLFPNDMSAVSTVKNS